jgi:hypothetical protein
MFIVRPLIFAVAAVVVFGMVGYASAETIKQDESDGTKLTHVSGWVFWAADEPYNTEERDGGGGNGAIAYGGDYPPNNPTGDGTWTPGLSGNYEVSTSWYVSTQVQPKAIYSFDVDGPGGKDAVTIGDPVDQTKKGDQSEAGSTVWSGFHSLGSFDLNPSSTFIMHCPTKDVYITTGVWQFTKNVPKN